MGVHTWHLRQTPAPYEPDGSRSLMTTAAFERPSRPTGTPYEGDVTVGLEPRDEDGSARARLVDVCGAAQLALAFGDQVAVLESVAHDDDTSTVALVLGDTSGRPVVRWAVQSDGTYSASVDGEPAPGS